MAQQTSDTVMKRMDVEQEDDVVRHDDQDEDSIHAIVIAECDADETRRGRTRSPLSRTKPDEGDKTKATMKPQAKAEGESRDEHEVDDLRQEEKRGSRVVRERPDKPENHMQHMHLLMQKSNKK